MMNYNFHTDFCNIALSNPKTSRLSNLFFIDKNFQDNIENICDFQVLGQQSSEVFIVSESVSYLYLGVTTNINARCIEYASDRTLEEGISKFQLTKSNRCVFEGKYFSFYLQSNQKPLDIFEFSQL